MLTIAYYIKTIKEIKEMAFNLIRNARVFFTTAVDSQGVISNTLTDADTSEIQVLDGLSFSQSTSSENVTLSEAGLTPVRGQRAFNTALEAVDISFSTYVRPNGAGTNVTAEESVLWNALLAFDAIGGSNPAWSEAPSVATCVGTNSQLNQLQPFGIIILLDGSAYAIDNCVADSATIDFGLDSISTIQWSLKGRILRELSFTADNASPVVFTGGINDIQTVDVDATGGTFTITYDSEETSALAWNITPAAMTTALEALSNVSVGDVIVSGGVGQSGGGTPYVLTWKGVLGAVDEVTTDDASLTGGAGTAVVSTTQAGGDLGSAKAKVTTAPFIANKLSSISITEGATGTGTVYTVPLTGGSLTISNNVTYLTPANLGVVNTPITYFTGTRAVSGSINAYLRTGKNESGRLLADMLAGSTTDVEPDYAIQIEIGGLTAVTRVEFDMQAAVLTIPTISTDQVISTTINFTAEGSTGTSLDLEKANELEIRYIAP